MDTELIPYKNTIIEVQINKARVLINTAQQTKWFETNDSYNAVEQAKLYVDTALLLGTFVPIKISDSTKVDTAKITLQSVIDVLDGTIEINEKNATKLDFALSELLKLQIFLER